MKGRIDQLKNDFILALPQRIYELDSACKALFEEPDSLALLTSLHGMVGALVAISSSAGAVQLSMAARMLERLLDDALQAPSSFDESRQQAFNYHLQRFLMLARQWRQGERIDKGGDATAEETPLLYIFAERPDNVGELMSLASCGYRLCQFSKLDELLLSCDETSAGAVVLDVSFVDSDQLGELNRLDIPLIIISEQSDIQSRLAAVRLGATRFFSKPIDMGKLKMALDGLTSRVPIKPYRVLIVDDEPSVAECYAAILRTINIEVECLLDPLEIFDSLERFEPELILMDIMMPGCDGLELAAVIRQDDNYNQIPVVFLSADDDLGKRMAAMNLGGDEFVSKPADTNYLKSVVLARVKRKRSVEGLNQTLQTTMRESEYMRVAMNHHVILSIADVNGNITFVNDKFCEVSGYQPDELLGGNYHIVKSNEHDSSFFREIWNTITRGLVWQGEVCNRCKAGSHYWVECTIVPFLDAESQPYQYISVCTDVTHMKEAEEVLTAARDVAEQASQAKTEFISHMSHELRTPLNAILGYAQLFDYDHGMNARQRKSAQEIYRAGQHLLSLVNDVLELSRIEAGCLELEIEGVALSELIEECRHLIMPQMEAREIKFQVNSCEQVVRADYTRLKQVLLNLLSNAIKYNRQGGVIRVNCQNCDDGIAQVSISDDGSGISQDKLSQLFQPFNRLGEEMGEVEGAGVGLALSKRLIEMMGGEISVDSKLGVGCTFSLKIPLAERQLARCHYQTVIEEGPPENCETKTLCYIEDNPANLRLMERIISQRDYIKMIHANTAEKGLILAKEQLPDLVLMDINLPGMDGYEALRVLRDDPATEHIPVMALSANAMSKDVERGCREGFVEYMTKPLNIKLFLKTLDRIWNIGNDS